MTNRDALPQLPFGSPGTKRRLRNAPLIDRLMFRTAWGSNSCWLWTGSVNSKGYGNIRTDGGGPVVSAHRASFEFFYGPIPDGMEIDHLCFVRHCINPEHLETVDHPTNVARGRVNQNDGATRCLRGHLFDESNTYVHRGKRECRSCRRIRRAEARAA